MSTYNRYHHHHHHHDDDDDAKAMIISYADSSYSSYGLITPPSEMRSNIELDNNPPPHLPDPNTSNILAPPANGRYFLRKQPQSQPPTYPTIINSNNSNNYNYNSYLHPRRRSVSSNSTSASSATSSSVLRPVSPPLDIESRDFNVGDFTATVPIPSCIVYADGLDGLPALV